MRLRHFMYALPYSQGAAKAVIQGGAVEHMQSIASMSQARDMCQGDENILDGAQSHQIAWPDCRAKNRYAARKLHQFGIGYASADLAEGQRLQSRHRHSIIRWRSHAYMITQIMLPAIRHPSLCSG